MAGDLFFRVGIDAGGVRYDMSKDLASLTLGEDRGKPDELTVELSDPIKVFSHAFREGMGIEVELGTNDDHAVVFRGSLYQVDGSFPETGVPKLTLRAYDGSMRMGLRRRNRVWTDMSLSDVVRAIGSSYFVAVDVELRGDPRFEGNGIRQQDETDLAFLRRLASENGCEMYVDSDDVVDTLRFRAQCAILEGEPEVTLYHGRCDTPARLVSFSAKSDVADVQLPRVLSGIDERTGQATAVKVVELKDMGSIDDQFLDENLMELAKRDPRKAAQLEMLLAAAPAVAAQVRADLGPGERTAVESFASEATLQQVAQNECSTRRLGMSASGSATGNRRMQAQTGIGIADVGGRFSGTWFLSQVRHIVNGRGYVTEFECER